MSPFSAIAFDLDNTLVQRDEAFRRLLTDWLQDVKGGGAYVFDCIMELDHHGYGSREELFSALEKMNVMPGNSVDLWNRFRLEFPGYFTPDHAVLRMLERIRKENIKVAILSNGGAEVQRGKIKNAGLAPLFDRDLILISAEIGFEKPDPAAFGLLGGRLKCEAGEILFVGDHPGNDICGAGDCGLQTCWLKSENYEPPTFDFSINQLLELESIIWPTTT